MREISESESPGHVTAQTRQGSDTGGPLLRWGRGEGKSEGKEERGRNGEKEERGRREGRGDEGKDKGGMEG